jgi:hypothetical protein
VSGLLAFASIWATLKACFNIVFAELDYHAVDSVSVTGGMVVGATEPPVTQRVGQDACLLVPNCRKRLVHSCHKPWYTPGHNLTAAQAGALAAEQATLIAVVKGYGRK